MIVVCNGKQFPQFTLDHTGISYAAGISQYPGHQRTMLEPHANA